MEFKRKIAEFSLDRYRQVTIALAAFTLICAAFVPWTGVDTSVESMLATHDAVRVFHEQAGRDLAFNHDGEIATSAYGMLASMVIGVSLAVLTIFILKRRLFRNLVLVLVPMIIAAAATLVTMGLLAALRFPLHRIDTMIPVFLMPISAVGSAYVLSEFLKRHTSEKGRRQATIETTRDLFSPTLHASLTVAAGFALLRLTPIPPVQTFGLFVAVGIMIAWAIAIVFVSASVMFLSEAALEKRQIWLPSARAKPAVAAIVIPIGVMVWGAMRMTANLAPQADVGSRTAYLVLEDSSDPNVNVEFIKDLRERLRGKIEELAVATPQARDMLEPTDRVLVDAATNKITKAAFLANLSDYAGRQRISTMPETADVWRGLADFFESENEQIRLFQHPEMLRYIADLVDHVEGAGPIDKSDHAMEDLWRLVAGDSRKANIRLQLTSGDSKDMKRVAAAVERYFKATVPPAPIRHNWAGRAHLDLVWRRQLARNVLLLLLGLFIIVSVVAAIPIAARRRLSSRSPVFSFLMMLSPAVVVLLVMLQFSRMDFGGFMWIGALAAPILAALNASLLRRRIDRTLFAQSTEATAA